MATALGSYQAPIVISDDEEDVVFVQPTTRPAPHVQKRPEPRSDIRPAVGRSNVDLSVHNYQLDNPTTVTMSKSSIKKRSLESRIRDYDLSPVLEPLRKRRRENKHVQNTYHIPHDEAPAHAVILSVPSSPIRPDSPFHEEWTAESLHERGYMEETPYHTHPSWPLEPISHSAPVAGPSRPDMRHEEDYHTTTRNLQIQEIDPHPDKASLARRLEVFPEPEYFDDSRLRHMDQYRNDMQYQHEAFHDEYYHNQVSPSSVDPLSDYPCGHGQGDDEYTYEPHAGSYPSDRNHETYNRHYDTSPILSTRSYYLSQPNLSPPIVGQPIKNRATPQTSPLPSIPFATTTFPESTNEIALTVASQATPSKQLPTVKAKAIKSIGTCIDDVKGNRGVYHTETKHFLSIEQACRSLVVENIPRKYRNVKFLRIWAKPFGELEHVEIATSGKGLVTFSTRKDAQRAYSSPLIAWNEGRSGVRVWWYRMPGNLPPTTYQLHEEIAQPVRALTPEEGEIEEDVVPSGYVMKLPQANSSKFQSRVLAHSVVEPNPVGTKPTPATPKPGSVVPEPNFTILDPKPAITEPKPKVGEPSVQGFGVKLSKKQRKRLRAQQALEEAQREAESGGRAYSFRQSTVINRLVSLEEEMRSRAPVTGEHGYTTRSSTALRQPTSSTYKEPEHTSGNSSTAGHTPLLGNNQTGRPIILEPLATLPVVSKSNAQDIHAPVSNDDDIASSREGSPVLLSSTIAAPQQVMALVRASGESNVTMKALMPLQPSAITYSTLPTQQPPFVTKLPPTQPRNFTDPSPPVAPRALLQQARSTTQTPTMPRHSPPVQSSSTSLYSLSIPLPTDRESHSSWSASAIVPTQLTRPISFKETTSATTSHFPPVGPRNQFAPLVSRPFPYGAVTVHTSVSGRASDQPTLPARTPFPLPPKSQTILAPDSKKKNKSEKATSLAVVTEVNAKALYAEVLTKPTKLDSLSARDLSPRPDAAPDVVSPNLGWADDNHLRQDEVELMDIQAIALAEEDSSTSSEAILMSPPGSPTPPPGTLMQDTPVPPEQLPTTLTSKMESLMMEDDLRRRLLEARRSRLSAAAKIPLNEEPSLSKVDAPSLRQTELSHPQHPERPNEASASSKSLLDVTTRSQPLSKAGLGAPSDVPAFASKDVVMHSTTIDRHHVEGQLPSTQVLVAVSAEPSTVDGTSTGIGLYSPPNEVTLDELASSFLAETFRDIENISTSPTSATAKAGSDTRSTPPTTLGPDLATTSDMLHNKVKIILSFASESDLSMLTTIQPFDQTYLRGSGVSPQSHHLPISSGGALSVPTPSQSGTSTPAELVTSVANRAQRLERYITDTKATMAKLATAKGREKDAILARLRLLRKWILSTFDRIMDEEVPAPTNSNSRALNAKTAPFVWPTTADVMFIDVDSDEN